MCFSILELEILIKERRDLKLEGHGNKFILVQHLKLEASFVSQFHLIIVTSFAK